MANFELKMPKLGESITEATITKWLKQVGDRIELDEAILELATDKVDSEIPSPVEGVLKEQLFKEGETVAVETIIAIIDLDGEAEASPSETPKSASGNDAEASAGKEEAKEDLEDKAEESDISEATPAAAAASTPESHDEAGRFYSPLVRSIAKEENIPFEELQSIKGSGQNGRLTKADLVEHIKTRSAKPASSKTTAVPEVTKAATPSSPQATPVKKMDISVGQGDEVLEMDRMRKLIADHMVMSEATSVHITLFTDVDMTKLVHWRNKQKAILEKRENEKLTFTPIFIEAIAKALRDYPMVNISVDGNNIIKRKHINIGMAAALPNGNLIVPVIKQADHKSLLGLAKEVNDLANRARQNQLKPDEIQGGTFTLTNFGTFGATSGTPIINQPQVAILGVGLIQKKPVVIETPQGDTIGIRHKMILSLSCDHRVVDGGLGSLFMKRVAENLENFDTNQNI
jgi:2-oxoglutarate dehydrogenase E2 component (dihydrolipoamide succinyltransferase)